MRGGGISRAVQLGLSPLTDGGLAHRVVPHSQPLPRRAKEECAALFGGCAKLAIAPAAHRRVHGHVARAGWTHTLTAHVTRHVLTDEDLDGLNNATSITVGVPAAPQDVQAAALWQDTSVGLSQSPVARRSVNEGYRIYRADANAALDSDRRGRRVVFCQSDGAAQHVVHVCRRRRHRCGR